VIESFPELRSWDVKILATDLDSDVLAKAQRGVYLADRVRSIGAQRLARFFVEKRGRDGISYEVAAELTALITFKQLNLMHSLPMKGPLDAIFCRNVVIYFDKDTQRELFSRVATLQRPGDFLFLGHSESLFKVSESYTPIGKTVYRRA
jgi:chemotaxis protein methyltransferase CheR